MQDSNCPFESFVTDTNAQNNSGTTSKCNLIQENSNALASSSSIEPITCKTEELPTVRWANGPQTIISDEFRIIDIDERQLQTQLKGHSYADSVATSIATNHVGNCQSIPQQAATFKTEVENETVFSELVCSLCHSLFNNAADLASHFCDKHLQDILMASINNESKQRPLSFDDIKGKQIKFMQSMAHICSLRFELRLPHENISTCYRCHRAEDDSIYGQKFAEKINVRTIKESDGRQATIFECRQCQQKFRGRLAAREHCNEQHPEPDVYHCDFCEYSCTTAVAKAQHERKKHALRQARTGRRKPKRKDNSRASNAEHVPKSDVQESESQQQLEEEEANILMNDLQQQQQQQQHLQSMLNNEEYSAIPTYHTVYEAAANEFSSAEPTDPAYSTLSTIQQQQQQQFQFYPGYHYPIYDASGQHEVSMFYNNPSDPIDQQQQQQQQQMIQMQQLHLAQTAAAAGTSNDDKDEQGTSRVKAGY